MTDHQTEPLDREAQLAQRYGRRTTSRGLLVAVGVAFAVLVAVIGWLIYQSSGTQVQAALHSWDEPRDGVLSATVEIRREAGLAVTCDLVAVDLRRVVVGQLELAVPAGPDEHLRVTADIPLAGDGVVPQLRGCRATE